MVQDLSGEVSNFTPSSSPSSLTSQPWVVAPQGWVQGIVWERKDLLQRSAITQQWGSWTTEMSPKANSFLYGTLAWRCQSCNLLQNYAPCGPWHFLSHWHLAVTPSPPLRSLTPQSVLAGSQTLCRSPPQHFLCSTRNAHCRPGYTLEGQTIPSTVLIFSSLLPLPTPTKSPVTGSIKGQETHVKFPEQPLWLEGKASPLLPTWDVGVVHHHMLTSFPKRILNPGLLSPTFIPWVSANADETVWVTSFLIILQLGLPMSLKCESTWHIFCSDFGHQLKFQATKKVICNILIYDYIS